MSSTWIVMPLDWTQKSFQSLKTFSDCPPRATILSTNLKTKTFQNWKLILAIVLDLFTLLKSFFLDNNILKLCHCLFWEKFVLLKVQKITKMCFLERYMPAQNLTVVDREWSGCILLQTIFYFVQDQNKPVCWKIQISIFFSMKCLRKKNE